MKDYQVKSKSFIQKNTCTKTLDNIKINIKKINWSLAKMKRALY